MEKQLPRELTINGTVYRAVEEVPAVAPVFAAPIVALPKMSGAESQICEILTNFGIRYKYDMNFNGIDPISVNFFLEDYYAAIEFDGRKRFEVGRKCKNDDGLRRRREEDENKDRVCRGLGLALLRIPYTKSGNSREYIAKFLEMLKNRERDMIVAPDFAGYAGRGYRVI
jgi:hypothetical protein